MRPFYEQYHYDHRPTSKVGDKYIPEFVTDFTKWYDENLEKTNLSRSGEDYMTASSMLDRKKFRQTVRRGIGGYTKSVGEWPDFIRPRSFTAMNVMHALTMPMPKKQPADKLHVGDFIPSRLSNQIGSAMIVRVWDSGSEVNFDGLTPGVYFFKANHGSRFNIKVTVPCSDAEMAHIRSEADRWLSTAYGENSCQWWYQFIEPKVFLEVSLTTDDASGPIQDFRFHVINGEPALLQLEMGVGTEERHNPVYDADLNYIPLDFMRENLREEPLPELTDKAQDIAVELGSQFQYCRVDLYVQNNTIHLGELTFLPNAGRRAVQSPELDEYLCAFWQGQMPEVTRIH